MPIAHGGRRAWPGTPLGAVSLFRVSLELGSPKFLARIRVQTDNQLSAVARAERVELSVDDGRAGVAAPRVFVSPEELRAIFRPRLEETGVR